MATIANLSIAVTINAGNSTQQLRALTVQVQNFSSGFQGSMTRSIAYGNLFSQAISRIFSAAAQNMGTFVSNAIKYSREFNDALVGLSSVSNAFGISAAGATAAARQLSADGLLPLRDSAAGLKNLLMTGFGLEDSIKIMNVFKDAAVYGRQGFLSYGDAIRTATEGLKNSQSRLVDNVGITKNLSVIMKEHGFQLQDISDKTKGAAARQALMLGLMREGAAMAGDAARSLNTYTGAVTAVNTAWISFQAEAGNAITTNRSVFEVINVVADALRDMTEWLSKTGKGSYFVSDALVFMLRYLKATVIVLQLTAEGLGWLSLKVLEGAKSIIDFATKSVESIKLLIWALGQLPGGTAALEAMGVSLEEWQTKVDTWRRRQDDIAEAITTVKNGQAVLNTVFEAGKQKIDQAIDVAKKYRGVTVDIGAAGRQAGQGLIEQADGMDRVKKKTKETIDTYSELIGLMEDMGDNTGMADALKAIVKQLPAFQKGMEGTRDAMFGFKEIKDAWELVNALQSVDNISRLTVEQMEDLEKTLKGALDRMAALGVTAPEVFRDMYEEAQRLPKQIREVREEMDAAARDFNRMIENLASPEAGIKIIDADKMWRDIFDPNKAKQLAGQVKAAITQELKDLDWAALTNSLGEIFQELPYIIRDAMAAGESVFEGLGRAAGGIFMKNFTKIMADKKPGQGATKGEAAIGLAGVGLESFFGGYDIGRSGGKVKGAIGGAASGALSGAAVGTMIMPGVGTAVGAAVGGIAGLFGGLFGGAKKAKEELKQVKEAQQALIDQYGGMEKLRDVAERLGVDISKAFNAKTPKQFEAAIKELNDALAEQKKRIEGLNTALKGVNNRAALFADKFSKVYEAANKPPEGDKLTDKEAQARANATKKLQEMAQSSEAEFGRLGLMIRDTFAGLVKETGSGISALQQMAPAFQMLEDGVSKWGITSTAVIDELRANFALVNDETFKPLFEQIASTGEVLRGLVDAKALSPEGFQAIAADIGASIQGIIDKGGDAAKTLALSQPVLQTLWEAQQQYGAVTDETTQAILNQAEEQGLVGEHMKGVNEKILDVLLAIGQVLGADLPEYLDKLKQPAADAAASIEDSFKNIDIPTISVPYEYHAQNSIEGADVPHLAAGGIVRRPTLALIGEAGPEAVVPLSHQTALGVESANYETTIYLDGEKIARSTAKKLPKIMRGLGVGH